MRVLVLGGTGTIGRPIVRELIRGGHGVLALARSAAAAGKLAALGAQPVPGDLLIPQRWLSELPPIDGVIQVAAAFDENDAAADGHLLDALLPYLSAAPRKARFLYTGGCWLFGATGGRVANEQSPFDPLALYAWSVPRVARVLAARDVEPIVIHPAMVYEAAGGVFDEFRRDALARKAVRVVGGEAIRWPLVHSEDLAVLYRLALESGVAGQSYIGSAIDGMAVGRIARAYARRFATPSLDPEIMDVEQAAVEFGEWARGYVLDQLLSGDKARRDLGWVPRHLDPEKEIGAAA
jgi:nucleoside-diphosphate-sugar epimerase